MGDRLINQSPRYASSTAKSPPWIDENELELLRDGLNRDEGGNMAASTLLADVTSLMLLSAAAGKFCVSGLSSEDNSSGLVAATNSAVDLLMKSLQDHPSGRAASTSGSDDTLFPNDPCQSPESPSADISKWARERDPVGQSLNPSEPMESMDSSQLSEYQSCESDITEVFRSCESTPDSPVFSADGSRCSASAMSAYGETFSMHTLDSGVASPSSVAFRSPATATDDLKNKVALMKECVDRKLTQMLTDVRPSHREDHSANTISEMVGTEDPLLGRLDQLRQRQMHDNYGSVNIKTNPMQELLVERAVTSSFLLIENTKLSEEVSFLKRKVELLTQMQRDKDRTGMNVNDCEVQTSPGLTTSDDNETDFGESDMHSPDSVYLLPTSPSLVQHVQLRPRPRHLSVGDDMCDQRPVVTTPTRSTPRRKLEVPSPLRAANYLSIASDDESENDSEMKFATFLCSGFCCSQIFGCC